MSLKDAIREAVDERDKQTPHQKDLQPKDAPQTSIQAEEPPRARTANTASSKAVNTASSKGSVQAPRPTQATGNSAATQTEKVTQAEKITEETAAMTVRVSRRHRLHWLISAKQEGTSLTAAITEALNARFGEPRD